VFGFTKPTVTTVFSPKVTVGPGATGTAWANCPPGTRVSGNGFSIEGGMSASVPESIFAVTESDSFTYSSATSAKNKGTALIQAINIFAVAQCLSVPW